MTSITGIDHNWKTDFLIGVGAAIGFLILGGIFSIVGVIGIPSVSASLLGDVGRWVIVVISASIFETVFFFEFMLSFFKDKVPKNFDIKIPFFIAAILTSVGFAVFHALAYGSLTEMGGSFVSAGLIGFGWCYLRKWTKSLLPLIISHMILNAWILSKSLALFV